MIRQLWDLTGCSLFFIINITKSERISVFVSDMLSLLNDGLFAFIKKMNGRCEMTDKERPGETLLSDADRAVNRLLDQLYELTGGDLNRLELLSAQEVLSLFQTDRGILSKTPFRQIKNNIIRVCRALRANGIICEKFECLIRGLTLADILDVNQMRRFYYRDIDDLMQTVSRTAQLSELPEGEDVLPIRTAVLLLWCGMEVQNILSLKKNEIVNHQLHLPKAFLPLEALLYQTARQYGEADGNRSLISGGYRVYKPSDFLFRTSVAPRMTVTAFSNMLKNFNHVSEMIDRQISAPRLRRNGLYCSVLCAEDAGASVGDAIRLFIRYTNDPAAVSEFRKHYTAWKRLFYPERF